MHLPSAPPLAPWRRALSGLPMLLLLGCSTVPERPASERTGDALLALLSARGIAVAEQPPAVRTAPQRASDVVIAALNFLDVRYRNGGASHDQGFDCSGFTRYVFESSIGLSLPRTVDDQAGAPGLASVEPGELQPGDLVFFNTQSRKYSHVGIYVSEGKFVHAPRSGAAVRVEDMRVAYWARRFTGARRAELVSAAAATSDER